MTFKVVITVSTYNGEYDVTSIENAPNFDEAIMNAVESLELDDFEEVVECKAKEM